MSLSSMLFGRSGGMGQTPTMTPQQESVQNQILAQIPGLLGQAQAGAQPFDFGPIEDLAKTRFREETVPSIAERFTGMGAGGQRSSAFGSALGRAGAGLEQGLAGMRADIGMQGQQQSQGALFNLLNLLSGVGMKPSFESTYFPGQAGMAQQAGAGGLKGLMKLLPMLFGGGGD